MFVKGEHERQFAYEAHTACDKRGFVLGVEVTAGNVHDSVAWDKVYDNVTGKFEVQFVTMDELQDAVDRKENHRGQQNPDSSIHKVHWQEGLLQAMGIHLRPCK